MLDTVRKWLFAYPRLLLLIAVLIAAGLLGLLVRERGFDGTFQPWNVPGYGIPFLDVRLISGSAQSFARGLDPAVTNPGDPLQRLFNYPRIWYIFWRLPLTHALDVPFAIGMIVLFLVAIVVFPRKATIGSECLLFLGLVSPAAMLGYSRANVDLLFVAAVVLALILADRHAVAALGVLLAAGLFKIFPFLGLGLLLGPRKRSALGLIVTGVALSVLYLALTFRDLLAIFNITQKGYETAYGVAVLPALLDRLALVQGVLEHRVVLGPSVQALDAFFLRYPAAPYLFGVLLLVVMVYLGLRSRTSSADVDLRNLRAFRAGSAIYIGTFLLGNNFEYRLLFLLLAIPQLLAWARQKQRACAPLSIVVLVLIYAALSELLVKQIFAGFFVLGSYYANILTQLAEWALFAGLAFEFAKSLPDWLFDETARIFGHLAHQARLPGASSGPQAQG